MCEYEGSHMVRAHNPRENTGTKGARKPKKNGTPRQNKVKCFRN